MCSAHQGFSNTGCQLQPEVVVPPALRPRRQAAVSRACSIQSHAVTQQLWFCLLVYYLVANCQKMALAAE